MALTWQLQAATDVGTTDANGFVELHATADISQYYPDNYRSEYMETYISDPNYTVLSAQNTFSYYAVDVGSFVVIYDVDKDYIADDFELQLAEKFKPILHSHSWEVQEQLSDPYIILNHPSSKLWIYRDGEGVIYNNHISSFHHWYNWYWDTFGEGDTQHSFPGVDMRLDIPDDIRDQGAPVGSRPLFYHCYKEGDYYYLQYWYFFNGNDISSQSNVGAFHEGDLEHVSLKLGWISSTLQPLAINFYQHEGGHTKAPADCYWSSTNSPQWPEQQGYDEQHTHLHIWIAANSHASYNIYDKVYRFTLDLGIISEDYQDNCDFDLSPPNSVFIYDELRKMGEASFEAYPAVHGFTYWFHYFPKGGEDWIIFRGTFGADWYQYSVYEARGPSAPFFDSDNGNGYNHEWKDFTIDYSNDGFGNSPPLGNVSWVNDSPNGDYWVPLD